MRDPLRVRCPECQQQRQSGHLHQLQQVFRRGPSWQHINVNMESHLPRLWRRLAFQTLQYKPLHTFQIKETLHDPRIVENVRMHQCYSPIREARVR